VNLSKKKRLCEEVKLCVSWHHPTFSLAYIVDKVFIQAFGLACEVCVEISLLCFLPTTICGIADSVV